MSYPYNASGVMSSEELANLEDALTFDRSARLERQVRERAIRCAESCQASGQPWRCYFMRPLNTPGPAALDGGMLPPPGSSTRTFEVTVDVRGVRDYDAAVLLAEEQIRRQLAKLPWAKLPDLAASR